MQRIVHHLTAFGFLFGLMSLALAAPSEMPTKQANVSSAAKSVNRPTLVGQTTSGRESDLTSLKGQVVLIMVWSSECPVCLNKMSEIRANHAGWVQQGFQVVLVNTDLRPEPLKDWEALRQISIPDAQRWLSFWSRAPGFTTSLPLEIPSDVKQVKSSSNDRPGPNHTPLIYVLDRQGLVRFQSAGRLPSEVWDAIAELL